MAAAGSLCRFLVITHYVIFFNCSKHPFRMLGAVKVGAVREHSRESAT